MTGDNSTDAGVNRYETYTVNMISGTTVTALTTAAGNATFQKPVDNIGTKTIPNYTAYANNFIQTVSFGSCGTGQIFVGQRREGFIINVGEIFDLIDLNPLGGRNSTQNVLSGKNITSIAMQVPVACLTKDGKGSTTTADPVLGAYTTSYLRQARVLNPTPQSTNNAEVVGGAWTQVSRLGHPLVNEVVIGLPDKDRFNDSQPKDDAQFATYVTNPTLPVLINALFPMTTVPAVPRTDLVAVFLTGLSLKATGGTTPIFSNNPTDYGDTVAASEELRLNTSIPPVATTAQSNLGLLACDTSGFPNGRRPGDDVDRHRADRRGRRTDRSESQQPSNLQRGQWHTDRRQCRRSGQRWRGSRCHRHQLLSADLSVSCGPAARRVRMLPGKPSRTSPPRPEPRPATEYHGETP